MARKKIEKITLGLRMKAGREKLGMSIGDLALETGYLPEILKGVEEERTVPPVSLILQLQDPGDETEVEKPQEAG